jgi:hypothetical protein
MTVHTSPDYDARGQVRLLCASVERRLSRPGEDGYALNNLFQVMQDYRSHGFFASIHERGMRQVADALAKALEAAVPGADLDAACAALSDVLRVYHRDGTPTEAERAMLKRFLSALRAGLS